MCNPELIVPNRLIVKLDKVSKLGWAADRALDDYKRRTFEEFEQIEPILRKGRKIESILDIGCGLAGLSALIARQFDIFDISLIDGDSEDISQRFVGFSNDIPKPWNSVIDGCEMMAANCPDAIISTYTPRSWSDVEFPEKFDLITSFKSWCHHYPFEAYADILQTNLKHGGLLIVDIRQGTDAFGKILEAHLECVEIIGGIQDKSQRFIFRKIAS